MSCCSGRRASLLGVPNLRRTSTRDPPQLRRGSVAEGWLRPSQGAEATGAPPGGFACLLMSAPGAAMYMARRVGVRGITYVWTYVMCCEALPELPMFAQHYSGAVVVCARLRGQQVVRIGPSDCSAPAICFVSWLSLVLLDARQPQPGGHNAAAQQAAQHLHRLVPEALAIAGHTRTHHLPPACRRPAAEPGRNRAAAGQPGGGAVGGAPRLNTAGRCQCSASCSGKHVLPSVHSWCCQLGF